MAEIQGIKFDKQIRAMVGDNDELVEKVKFNYARISPPKEGEKDSRLEDAITLTTGGRVSFNGIFGGDGTPPTTVKKVGLTQKQIEIGKEIGLTDEELSIK